MRSHSNSHFKGRSGDWVWMSRFGQQPYKTVIFSFLADSGGSQAKFWLKTRECGWLLFWKRRASVYKVNNTNFIWRLTTNRWWLYRMKAMIKITVLAIKCDGLIYCIAWLCRNFFLARLISVLFWCRFVGHQASASVKSLQLIIQYCFAKLSLCLKRSVYITLFSWCLNNTDRKKLNLLVAIFSISPILHSVLWGRFWGKATCTQPKSMFKVLKKWSQVW